MVTLEFIALGDQSIDGVPLRCVPLCHEPTAASLYQRRLEAMHSCKAQYLCFVDGGEDVCLPGFADAMQALADTGAPLGYAAELVNGQPRDAARFTPRAFMFDHSIVHHGVVCDVARLKAIAWPRGCYSWETIAYGTLAAQGFAFDMTPRYDWRPSSSGARLWPSFARGIVNSQLFLQGRPGTHFKSEMQ